MIQRCAKTSAHEMDDIYANQHISEVPQPRRRLPFTKKSFPCLTCQKKFTSKYRLQSMSHLSLRSSRVSIEADIRVQRTSTDFTPKARIRSLIIVEHVPTKHITEQTWLDTEKGVQILPSASLCQSCT